MKEVILHIGYNKTGTTAIQRAFYQNASMFEKNGILYPKKCMGDRKSPAHHSIAESMLFQINKPLPKFVNPKIYSDFPADHYWKLLLEEIEQSNCKKVFISSEAFSRFRGRKDQIVDIKKQLENYSVKILVYLRSQPEFLESAYNQAVKSEGESNTVAKLMNRGWLTIDYFAEIEQWAEVFGVKNIIVRIFDATHQSGGIVQDVLKVLGLENLLSETNNNQFHKQVSQIRNKRLPNNMVETKRRINTIVRKSIILDNFINSFLQWAGKYRKDLPLLTNEQIRIIKEHNLSSNTKLGEKYLGGKFPFS